MNLSSTEINQLINIVQQASDIIMNYYNTSIPEAERKKDNSPVTVADHHASDFIIKNLLEINASIPTVSEELTETENISIIKNNELFWLIDPIDGTWSFIRKKGIFTVNIALIKNGRPIWGIIGNPLDGAIYYINSNGSCMKYFEGHHNKIMAKSDRTGGVDFLVSHQNLNQRMQDYIAQYEVNTITPVPSSIKFALMAEGKGDIYPRFKPTCIWDTAAGHALLYAVGGNIFDLEGRELIYNSGVLENPNFVALAHADSLKSDQ